MKKGFTLIELILVVAITIILSGVVFTISLNSFKNSKVEGFSNEALSLIRRLYDYQNNEMLFVDQVKSESIDETYNIIFKVENDKLTVKLRHKAYILDEVLISNIAFSGDIKARFYENNTSEFKTLTIGEDYTFSFDSKGRVALGKETLNSLKIVIYIDEGHKNSIIITNPPGGNIILKKGDGNEKI